MTGTHVYVQDVRCPAWCTGASLGRRASARRSCRSTSDPSRTFPGVIRVVRKGTFVGVVAEREEQAVRAAKALAREVERDAGAAGRGRAVRDVQVAGDDERATSAEAGDVDAALRPATRTVRATYRWPFQLHASIGPSCAVADVRDGKATVWSATQGAHQLVRADRRAARDACRERARDLHRRRPAVTGTTDPTTSPATRRCCRRRSVGRCACSGVARTSTAWEPEGPAMVFEMAGAVGADGTISGVEVRRVDADAWRPPDARPGDAGAGHAGRRQVVAGDEFTSVAAASATRRRRTAA